MEEEMQPNMLTLFYDDNCIFVYADVLNYILASKHKYIKDHIANIYKAKTVNYSHIFLAAIYTDIIFPYIVIFI